jgi:two-component system sensor histidine kinase ResE
VKPSLVHRLRIGFVVTFALLAAITFLAVGHLFQLRQNYEDDTTRSFKVELASEHMRQAFLVEQATVASSAVDRQAAREKFKIDVSNFAQAAGDTRGLIEDDPRADQLVDASVAAEREWRQGAAEPILAGRPLPQSQQNSLAQSVQTDVDRLINSQDTKQSELRDKTASSTHKTVIAVALLLFLGLGLAVALFSGLIASMRKPLEELVDASGQLAEGNLNTRVEVGGPAETATLGTAFNEMAGELQGAYKGLEDSQRRLRTTMESLSDGVVTVDSRGVVTDANPAARRLLPAATVGSKIREALASNEIPPRKVDRLLAGKEREELRSAEGGTVLAITGSPMLGGGVLSIRDVSERARLERMKDEFVLTASHELRSPLTSVQGFAELLILEKDQLSEKHTETVEIILDNTRHLVRLLNDLLDLARSDAGRLTIHPTRSEVGPIVAGAARLIMGLTNSRQQRLEVEIESDLPQVSVEPDRIMQVLVNLLTNATEYCPEGSTIKVTAGSVGSEVEIAVADDGPGIPKDQRDHVFDRFTRGDVGLTQRVGGTGLGLAIAKSLIELHGGAIGVTSKEGEGATFRIVLPALSDREPLEEPAAAAAQSR